MHPNGIGQFEIGVSPIGDNSFYWPDTLYSQYANSPIITQLLDYYSQWIDPRQEIDNFFDQIWNIQTAQGYGLDVWGRIVGLKQGRVLTVFPSEFLSFNEAGDVGSGNAFGHATLYSGQALTDNVTLSDDAFRLLILAQAAANIWDGSTPGLNQILRTLFPGQVCYAVDGLDLTLTYTFEFTLTPVQLSIVQNAGVLPRPAGVLTSFVQI